MGWKDVLRPIRDGLRDNLPSHPPKDDDDAEKRRQKRDQDIFKGFTYFETFEEIEQWTPDTVDPLQRANTPLMQRSRVQPSDTRKSKIILVHDHAGNYHDYEAAQGGVVSKENYSCGYMQFVDSFVYFSHKVSRYCCLYPSSPKRKSTLHIIYDFSRKCVTVGLTFYPSKLMCIPPPTWTNSLHRNGVKSLGTFLVEPQTVGISHVLYDEPDPARPSASRNSLAFRLGQLANFYGFEGWLINIEKTFPFREWHRDKLSGFIDQLKSHLGDDNVIWYDALTVHNTIQYQNGLTPSNKPFAKAAGSLLTNYDWIPRDILQSCGVAAAERMSVSNIAFGIDVWAQNDGSYAAGRRTYGGGGTGTGIAVAKLAGYSLSAGIFGPAWPHEHFPHDHKAVERAMWEGEELPKSLSCGCKTAMPHHVEGYRLHSITQYAVEYAAGSEELFHTDFERPFQHRSNAQQADVIEAHLGRQSILPYLRSADTMAKSPSELEGRGILYAQLSDSPPRLSVFVKDVDMELTSGFLHSTKQIRRYRSLNLFNLKMRGSLDASVTFRKAETPEGAYLALEFEGTGEEIELPSQACEQNTVSIALEMGMAELTGIRIRVDNLPHDIRRHGHVPLLDILETTIKKKGIEVGKASISNIRLLSRNKHNIRLAWAYKCVAQKAQTTRDQMKERASDRGGLPYSKTTGPFAFFEVHIGGLITGRAYALQFALTEEMAHKIHAQNGIEIKIVGIGFDGTMVCQYTCRSEDIDLYDWDVESSWILVQRYGPRDSDVSDSRDLTEMSEGELWAGCT